MNGESSMEAYTLPYVKKDSQWESTVWFREHKPRLCDNLEAWDRAGGGREAEDGGGTCMPVSDSC